MQRIDTILSEFKALGQSIEAEFRRSHYHDQSLPEIAEKGLSEWQPSFELSINDLARLSLAPSVQHETTQFSDLPLIVYRTEAFYIECLAWSSATTSIHQHAFSGAFRLLSGSSFHSQFSFQEQERVGALFLLGESKLVHFERLRAGQIRPITSGPQGLIHSLYHLENPSITLVVRTPGEPWAQPQHEIVSKRVAAALQILEKDRRVIAVMKAVRLLSKSSVSDTIRFWCDEICRLDFPRVFTICLGLRDLLENVSVRNDVFSAMKRVHGSLSDRLEECLQERERQFSLSTCRSQITDPSLRFFLALLLNAGTRKNIYDALLHDSPEILPEDQCVRFLSQLGDPDALLLNLHEVQKKGPWASKPALFALDMLRCAKACEESLWDMVLRAVALGKSEEQLRDALLRKANQEGTDRAMESFRLYRLRLELRALWSES